MYDNPDYLGSPIHTLSIVSSKRYLVFSVRDGFQTGSVNAYTRVNWANRYNYIMERENLPDTLVVGSGKSGL
ncbi:MAG: hypothetical protein ACFFB5_09055 [Promethearchaeota archaeon]